MTGHIILTDEDVQAILDIDHPADEMILGLGFDARCECLQIMAACGSGNISRGVATDLVVKAFAREFPDDAGRAIMTRSINAFFHGLRPFGEAIKGEGFDTALPPAVERGPTAEMIGDAFAAKGVKPDDRMILTAYDLKPGDLVEPTEYPDDAGYWREIVTGVFVVRTVTLIENPGHGTQVSLSLARPGLINRVTICRDFNGWHFNVIERKPHLPDIRKGEAKSVGESLINHHAV